MLMGLRLCLPLLGVGVGAGLIRGQGATRIPEAVPPGQKSQDMERKQYCSKFTGGSENGPPQKNA